MRKRSFSQFVWVSAYPPDYGRLSEYAEALIGGLVSVSNSSFLVLSDCRPSELISGVDVKPVWRPDSLLGILNLWFEIIRSKSKVMHFNVSLSVFGRSRIVNFLGLLSVTVARLSRKRVIVTLHNIPEGVRLNVSGYRDNLVNRIGLEIVTKIVLSSAHTVVVLVRRYVKLLMSRYGAGNVVWIPHGAWFTDHHPSWKWQDGRVSVLFLGYLSQYKDLKLLSDVVKEIGGELLVSGRPNPNFVEEGKRVIEGVLRERHVKYLGYVSNERLPNLVSRVAVAALPYRACAGTSGVIHLLCGLGVPFVAFSTYELKELAEEGAGILLVDMSKEALRYGIMRVASDRQLAESLSKRSRDFALSRSWQKVAAMYLNVYTRHAGRLC
ncbi:MAG: glycosyltransferase [Nitrososphaerota archaeon]|nr:glycosyltransferase [Candidatus Bathyarchaeota archaeon]MDW8049292.1 glycosyltransferase [Nitrososphaerota archaeon]